MRRTGWLGLGVIALLAITGTAALVAPAQWAAGAIESASRGHLRLADARGTLWRGDATLVVAASGAADAVRTSLPERLSWRLAPLPLLLGRAELTLAHPSALAQPVTLQTGWSGAATISAGTLRLPAALLTGLGAPWNTVRPGGTLQLVWDRLSFDAGRMQGDLAAEWQYASSALSPVVPIGHYRLTASGGYPDTRLQLTTINGPLEMSGQGTIAAPGQVRFRGVARMAPGAEDAVKAQLAGLLSLLGKRDGENVILNLES
jgi:general secretion pathway protein N